MGAMLVGGKLTTDIKIIVKWQFFKVWNCSSIRNNGMLAITGDTLQDFPGIATSETLQDRDFTRLPWYRTLPSGKRSTCQCRGHGFDPWSGKILRATGQLSLCATTTEAHASWSPRSTTIKATTIGSLHSTTREIPHTATKTQCSQN